LISADLVTHLEHVTPEKLHGVSRQSESGRDRPDQTGRPSTEIVATQFESSSIV